MTFKVSNNLAMLTMLITGLHDAFAGDPTNNVEIFMGDTQSGESVHLRSTKSKYDIQLRISPGMETLLKIEYWTKGDLLEEYGSCIWHSVEIDSDNHLTWVDHLLVLKDVLDGVAEPDAVPEE